MNHEYRTEYHWILYAIPAIQPNTQNACDTIEKTLNGITQYHEYRTDTEYYWILEVNPRCESYAFQIISRINELEMPLGLGLLYNLGLGLPPDQCQCCMLFVVMCDVHIREGRGIGYIDIGDE